MSNFAKLYDIVMFPLEKLWLKRIRKRLLRNLSGRVLEIGAGTGANFMFYPSRVTVCAIEPNDAMLLKAREHANRVDAQIEVVSGVGERLACPDNSYDYAVVTLVLCSVSDPIKVLEEIRRILKPGGHLIMLEHVRVHNPFWAKVQDALTPTWAKMCDNCHLNRDTVKDVKQVFNDVSIKYYLKKIFVEINTIKK